ncbi:GNAT family N-acetyltransferase [Enterovibrio sp. ZSDZ35]|uniref:GNAT family N-acetyltransferase n=1 Tax=Enterovibrio qingdaonensis TaxID=2899818 RepID=A0ABT5QRQ8_9GAMM|nr:GNAT family N-acetyltransferase [Enterovibrio sp. ZSDZ35]MDD1783665.1 GNAT family N-acetyltransferase [Enterovibrio sp. ZSDZ35]
MRVAEVSPHRLPPALLLEADPSASSISTYLLDSFCFAAIEGDNILGACVLQNLIDGVLEINNLAIFPELQCQGLGSLLLQHVIDTAKKRSIRKIELGTGTFGHQLAFYQRFGFRVETLIKDYYIDNYEEPVWEKGIQHKDMLRLSLTL